MKLLIGGSPCTNWSIARKQGRETEPEGQGWELFQNYKIALEKFRPEYFLYENNNSISAAIKKRITAELGVEPIMINSALVSAQSRKRVYWTNIPGVRQPEDRGVVVRDILESGIPLTEKAYTLKANYIHTNEVNALDYDHFPAPMAAEPVRIGTIESGTQTNHDSKPFRVYSPDGKSVTISSTDGGTGSGTGLYAVPIDPNFGEFKATITFDEEGQMTAEIGGRARVIYEVRGGRITVKGKQLKANLADGLYIIRRLTVLECKRLQTVPDSYIFPVSKTQAYRQLGNGWTVDVIAHILSFCPGITEKPLEVLSMYDGMSCGRLALDKLGASVAAYWATEIDKYAIQTTQANFPDTVQLGDAFQVREDGWKPWEGVKQ